MPFRKEDLLPASSIPLLKGQARRLIVPWPSFKGSSGRTLLTLVLEEGLESLPAIYLQFTQRAVVSMKTSPDSRLWRAPGTKGVKSAPSWPEGSGLKGWVSSIPGEIQPSLGQLFNTAPKSQSMLQNGLPKKCTDAAFSRSLDQTGQAWAHSGPSVVSVQWHAGVHDDNLGHDAQKLQKHWSFPPDAFL